MSKEELERKLKIFAIEDHLDYKQLEVIPKSELIVNQWYTGTCRNASQAKWMGDHFIYLRTKFYDTFWEKINHFEDDDGYDLFIPVRLKNQD